MSGVIRTVLSHEQKWEGRAIFCPNPPICRLSLTGEARYIDPSSFRVGDAFQIGFLFHLDHHGFADIADLEDQEFEIVSAAQIPAYHRGVDVLRVELARAEGLGYRAR